MCWRNTGINLTSIETSPFKSVKFPWICSIPCGHFVCFKVFNSTSFKNLWHNRAVAKDIRQPAIINFYSEFFQEVPFPVENLPNKTFSLQEITVRFNIKSTNNFPTTLCYSFFNLRKDFRVILLKSLICPCLGMRI